VEATFIEPNGSIAEVADVGRIAAGVFVCGGFTGHGMAFGPASAELVAALVRGATHPDADLFDPMR